MLWATAHNAFNIFKFIPEKAEMDHVIPIQ